MNEYYDNGQLNRDEYYLNDQIHNVKGSAIIGFMKIDKRNVKNIS